MWSVRFEYSIVGFIPTRRLAITIFCLFIYCYSFHFLRRLPEYTTSLTFFSVLFHFGWCWFFLILTLTNYLTICLFSSACNLLSTRDPWFLVIACGSSLIVSTIRFLASLVALYTIGEVLSMPNLDVAYKEGLSLSIEPPIRLAGL